MAPKIIKLKWVGDVRLGLNVRLVLKVIVMLNVKYLNVTVDKYRILDILMDPYDMYGIILHLYRVSINLKIEC